MLTKDFVKILSLFLVAIVLASTLASMAEAHSAAPSAADEPMARACHEAQAPASEGDNAHKPTLPTLPINYKCCLTGHDTAMIQDTCLNLNLDKDQSGVVFAAILPANLVHSSPIQSYSVRPVHSSGVQSPAPIRI